MNTTASTPAPDVVAQAAADIVDAFRRNDGRAYFAAFAPDASFVFHPEPARLDSRRAYEDLWNGWIEAGWRVLECRSLDPLIQVWPGGAVFSHTVHTTVETGTGQTESYRERESIVFRVEGGTLNAVHEHLSPFAPAA